MFAEVGNLIRRKNKNSHCAGDRGLREAGGAGLQAQRHDVVRGWGVRAPQNLERQRSIAGATGKGLGAPPTVAHFRGEQGTQARSWQTRSSQCPAPPPPELPGDAWTARLPQQRAGCSLHSSASRKPERGLSSAPPAAHCIYLEEGVPFRESHARVGITQMSANR